MNQSQIYTQISNAAQAKTGAGQPVTVSVKHSSSSSGTLWDRGSGYGYLSAEK